MLSSDKDIGTNFHFVSFQCVWQLQDNNVKKIQRFEEEEEN